MNKTIENTLQPNQISMLNKFAVRMERFSTDLLVLNPRGGLLLSNPGNACDVKKFAGWACDLTIAGHIDVQKFGSDKNILGRILKAGSEIAAVAFINTSGDISGEREIDLLEEVFEMFGKEFEQNEKNSQNMDIISNELSRTYEELVLLYNMSTNMKVTQSHATYLQMACDQITQLVNVEGIAIFLERQMEDDDIRYILAAGSGLVPLDQVTADILQLNLIEELKEGKEALLDSQVDSDFKYNWPERVKNIIAVPLNGKDKMIGFMVATNIINKPDFDSMEAKLFNSVANQCAIFLQNGRLFSDLKELFIGSMKALTNSIDAKDQYTRGHSERVAFISRWIAEQVAEKRTLDEEYIHKIYLSGLLHDIGKIGINEAVLCKKGKLSDTERKIIMSHPRIGAAILADIKQMTEIISGVLYHHERPDGKGYPEGLTDKQIPLIGKIISLADSFDAMTSRRVYRDAMTIEDALEEIERNLGTQFDAEIGRIFVDSDVNKLWTIIQDGFIERWDYSNFDEYGTIAVGTLLR